MLNKGTQLLTDLGLELCRCQRLEGLLLHWGSPFMQPLNHSPHPPARCLEGLALCVDPHPYLPSPLLRLHLLWCAVEMAVVSNIGRQPFKGCLSLRLLPNCHFVTRL